MNISSVRRTHAPYAGISRATVAQKPRIIPFRRPQVLQVSPTTVRSRLSPGSPYCPCIFTLKSSTTKPGGRGNIESSFQMEVYPGRDMTGRTGACENRVDGTGHRSCQGHLGKSNMREGCNNTLRDVVCSKEERVDCCNANQGAYHTYRVDCESSSNLQSQGRRSLPLYKANAPSLRIICTRMSMGPFYATPLKF